MTQAQTAFFTAASLGLKNDKKRVLNDVIRGIKETVDTNSGNIDSNDTTIAAITGTLNKYADAFSVSGSTTTFSGLIVADSIDVQTLNAANLQFSGDQTINGDFDVTGSVSIGGGNIELNSDGSAEFSEPVLVNGATQYYSAGLTTRDGIAIRAGDNDPSLSFVSASNHGTALIISSGSNSVGYLDFYTRRSGATNYRARIDEHGNFLIGGTESSPNIELKNDGSAEFSGSVSIGGTAAANTIDEYEEGTWTPSLLNSGGTQMSTSSVAGRYIKIGSQVTCWGSITATSGISGTLDPYMLVRGLPFPVGATSPTPSPVGIGSAAQSISGTEFKPMFARAYTQFGQTQIFMYRGETAFTGGTGFKVVLSYRTID